MIDDFNGGQVPRQKQKLKVSEQNQVKTTDSGFTSEELSGFDAVSFDEAQQTQGAATSEADTSEQTAQTEPKQHRKLKFTWPPTKKQGIIAALVIVVVLAGGGTGWALTHKKTAVVASTPKRQTKTVAKPVEPIYSNLSGLAITDVALNQKSVTGVMIENSMDARPQSGLAQAGVVFEAVAEGGVTRFLALYQDQVPTNVGPIRSARPYYVAWNQGFDAAYAHVGGSPDALANITAWGVKDMNQFYNGGSYHRVSNRAAPHNVYTGIDTLNQLESAKGYAASNYTGFVRKADTPYVAAATTSTTAKAKTAPAADTRTAASSIDMRLSGPSYDPHYDYDTTSNSYKRSEAGSPQTDANNSAQLSPKVVIAIVLPLSQGALDASGAYYSNYNVLGTGQALVFQDGTVTTAQWTKPDNKTNISFSDAAGNPLKLNRGQTWISAVTGTSKVTYK